MAQGEETDEVIAALAAIGVVASAAQVGGETALKTARRTGELGQDTIKPAATTRRP